MLSGPTVFSGTHGRAYRLGGWWCGLGISCASGSSLLLERQEWVAVGVDPRLHLIYDFAGRINIPLEDNPIQPQRRACQSPGWRDSGGRQVLCGEVVTDASRRFSNGEFTDGLVRGFETVGAQLAVDFPFEPTADVRDLADHVDFR
jgi:hypothetical protein